MLVDSQYQDEHSNLNFPEEMMVKAWFDYWISMKKRTVCLNMVRNYTECYERNIDPVIGKLILPEVKPIQCQMIIKNPCNGMVKSDIGKPTQKNLEVKVIPMEWSEYVFLCRKGTPVKTARMIPCCLNSVTR